MGGRSGLVVCFYPAGNNEKRQARAAFFPAHSSTADVFAFLDHCRGQGKHRNNGGSLGIERQMFEVRGGPALPGGNVFSTAGDRPLVAHARGDCVLCGQTS